MTSKSFTVPWATPGSGSVGLQKSDEVIRSILTAPTTTLRYLLDPSGLPIGLFEAEQQETETLEVTYFGLIPEATGKSSVPS
jgi:hypothetical protein